PVRRLLQESWSLDFQAFTVPGYASASASVDGPSACEYATCHAATDFASITCSRRNAARSRATITPAQTRRAYWQCAACFSRGYRESKSWFALWNSGSRPERYGHESLSAGRGQVYRCH